MILPENSLRAKYDEPKEDRHQRIKRVKRWLKPLPRRTNIHRYPVLKWFSRSAQKKAFLWSFQPEYLIPAIYLGSILAFLPLYGLQLILGMLLALLLKTNLLIVSALIFISNPLTVAPIYYVNCLVGKFFANLFFTKEIEMLLTPQSIINTLASMDGKDFLSLFCLCSIGGLFIGITVGLIFSLSYKKILFSKMFK